MKITTTKLITSIVALSLSSVVLAQKKFTVPPIDIKEQYIKIPVKETIKPTFNFGLGVNKNACSATDYNVNTTEEGDDIEESCSAERCTIRAAIREAVIDSIHCDDNAERKVILQPNAQYMIYEAPLPQAFDGSSGPGGYRIGRTAFPSFTQGKYTVIGNGATIEREPRGRGENNLRFFDISTNADVTLENLILKNGLAKATSGAGYESYKNDGGAIYNQGQLTVSSVIFDGNKVVSGAIQVGSDVAIGGAIYNSGRGSLVVYDSTFVRNSAANAAAIANYSSGVFVITRTDFIGNQSRRVGGSIVTNIGNGQINGSNFSYNLGGNVIRSLNRMRINDSSFTRNGINQEDGTNSSIPAVIGGWKNTDASQLQRMIIKRSTFAENDVINGVVFIDRTGVDVELISSTIANNRSRSTAINCAVRNSIITISDSTIANNNNSTENLILPTGISISGGCELGVNNTVITSDIGATCGFNGTSVPAVFSGSFSDDMNCRTSAVGNAMLGELADNGGDTQTMMPRLGSPLIDAIPHNLAGSESLAEMMEDAYRSDYYGSNDYWRVMDQRFLPRYIDGLKDIGAVERQSSDL